MSGGNLELPYPAKILWPNGRPGHWAQVRREARKHREWAFYAAIEAGLHGTGVPARWSATFYPKTAHRVDTDNAAASLKAYQDGIAAAIGVDDKDFPAPTVRFAEPVKGGRVVIVLGEAA